MYTIRKTEEEDMPFLLEIDRMSCERDDYRWDIEKREPLIRRFVEGREGFGFITEVEYHPIGALMIRIARSSEVHYSGNPARMLQPLIGNAVAFAEIFDIWVDPDHRRKHVASELKKAFEVECRERRIEWIFTFQHPENTAAIKMNESLGYQHIGESKMYDDVLRVCFLRKVPAT